MITINPKDALRAEQITPGWMICLVENHYEKPAASDGSRVDYFEITVDEGQFKGTPLQAYTLSEKAVSMGKNFFIACGLPQETWEAIKKGEAFTLDPKNCVGKRIKVMVSNEKYENRFTNRATDFLPLN